MGQLPFGELRPEKCVPDTPVRRNEQRQSKNSGLGGPDKRGLELRKEDQDECGEG